MVLFFLCTWVCLCLKVNQRLVFKANYKLYSSLFDAWRGRVLSFVRRICFVNSMVTSSFVHSFMLYKWPKALLHFMNKAIRNYISSGSINDKKWVLVAWNSCCLHVKQWGLGIKNLVLFNKAFLSLLAWKFFSIDNFCLWFSLV